MGKDERYTLEELVDIFEEHHKMFLDDRRDAIDRFTRDNPGEEIPTCFLEDFSLPKAFQSMVGEIMDLKK